MNAEPWPLLDAHVHLQDPRFTGELEMILDRARLAGVVHWVCNGTDENDWGRVLELARKHARVIPCLGLHPWRVLERSQDWLVKLEWLLQHSASGVGEIGLDRWIKNRIESEQETVFREQLRLARKLNRPVMIHCVRAWDWLMRVLSEELAEPHPVLIHAFGGPSSLIQPLAERGAYFSIAGNIFQPRKSAQRAMVKQIPRERLLLETDAPDLLPPLDFLRIEAALEKPHYNEPANLQAIFLGVAQLLAQDPGALAHELGDNSRRFLGDLLLPNQDNPARSDAK